MKNVFLFLLWFSIIHLSNGQNEIKDVPRGTSKIIVSNSKTSLQNYQTILNKLLDNDFEIEQKDIELFTIRTGFKSFKRGGSFYLNFRCKDNSIEIIGKFYSGFSIEINGVKAEDNLEQIVNKGMKGSIYKNAFIEMFKFSKLISEDLTFM